MFCCPYSFVVIWLITGVLLCMINDLEPDLILVLATVTLLGGDKDVLDFGFTFASLPTAASTLVFANPYKPDAELRPKQRTPQTKQASLSGFVSRGDSKAGRVTWLNCRTDISEQIAHKVSGEHERPIVRRKAHRQSWHSSQTTFPQWQLRLTQGPTNLTPLIIEIDAQARSNQTVDLLVM